MSALALKPEDCATAVAAWRADPVRFAREVLGVKTLWAKQIAFLESVRDNRETNVLSGHGVGKDHGCSCLVPWWLLTQPDSLVVTTATTARQVEAILWGEIRARVHGALMPLGGDLAPVAAQWRFGPKWYAIGLTAADPNGFAGFHSKRVLLIRDEAAGIAPEIWDASESCASGDNDRILNIGNPVAGPTHPFIKASALPDVPGKRKMIRIATTETPNYLAGRDLIPGMAGRAYVESMATKYGEGSVTYNARVLGIAPGSAADGLISFEHLQLARDRLTRGVKPEDGDVVRLGCDPARYGDDLTVIYAVHGPKAWEVAALSKYDGPRIANRLVLEANRLGARSVAIDTTGGYGDSPYDFFQQALMERKVTGFCTVHRVNFGSGAKDPDQHSNRRTELWWNLRDWIAGKAAYVPDDTVSEELLAATFKPHKEGIALEPKEKLKERIGRSPDRADALALAVSGHIGGSPVIAGESISAAPSPETDRPARFEDSFAPASPW